MFDTLHRAVGGAKCRLGFHVGHVRVDSRPETSRMWFHCVRCGADVSEREYDPMAFRADANCQGFGEWLDD